MDLETKGDIRNPSAFVSKALHQFPYRRGDGPGGAPLYAMLHQRGPVMAAVQSHVKLSGSLKKVLSHYPEVQSSLDGEALSSLQSADPERAVELVQDLAGKRGVRNPSAFVVKALAKFPTRRSAVDDLDSALARRPWLQRKLDERAMAKLMEADPARAVEIVEDVASRHDVQNPSAFVFKALAQHAHKRTADEPSAKPPAKRPRGGGGLRGGLDLDDQAKSLLEAANQLRAAEVLQELAEKGSDVRNPSAFVSKALRQFPNPRGKKA